MENEIKPGLDGMYAFCFVNDKAYNENKIWEVFERYGRVSSVRCAGNGVRPLVFVRYKEYNEAKRCFDHLNETKELSIRVAYPSRKLPAGGPCQQTRVYVTCHF
jgi:hypothetical protein